MAKNTGRLRESPLTMRILKTVRLALDKAAENESRNRAHMAEYILANWLRDKGYLKDRVQQ